ncbi:MDR family MFS transporter [Uliginosibacterium sediminicola]|uniref:MDR family MFS transporter n=1 Tax=Uliginosibacterium sediminicola TaxID=2024550 RepID=A0ABU9Z1T9_9RHOO
MNAAAAPRSFSASLSAMIGICLVIMLIALDSTVVGTAMPRIIAELQGYELYTWTASAYLLTNAVMIPIMGRLGDLYGRKPFVIGSILLFTLASALCGLSQSMLQLVLARGLQGIGGGMLTGVAFASVSDLFPDRIQRVRWQAMLSATFGISTAIGPSLGGWLTEHAGWRSVFYVNLPVALLALPVIARYLPHIMHHKGSDKSIDWLGALLLAASISCLLLATEHGQMHGFLQLQFIGLALAALAGGALFIWHQQHSRAPIIPARLFANRAVRQLTALGALTGLVMFVLIYYSPLLLQGGFDLSPKTAGLLLTPLLVLITVGSIINGRLISQLRRPERLIAYGQIGLLAGCLLLIQMHADSPQFVGMFAFGVCGLALGFQLPNLTLQIQAVVERRDIGVASALIQTTRMLGSMVGTSLAAVIVNSSYSRHVSSLLAAHDLHDAALDKLLDTPQILVRVQDQAALAELATRLHFAAQPLLDEIRVGLIKGVHHVYLGCAVVVLFAVMLALKLPHYDPHRSDK